MKGDVIFMAKIIIDVSKWNGDSINWGVVKNYIDGVIIRVGYRGYTDGTLKTDPQFRIYADQCVKHKIPFSVYWFAQEITEEESVETANYIYELVKDYKLSLPVYYDVEYSGELNLSGRADVIGKVTRTNCVVAFCEEIKRLGLIPGVYANIGWFKDMMDFSKINDYSIWCAKWNDGTKPSIKHDIWQYTNKGSVTGITGYVDLSIANDSIFTNTTNHMKNDIDTIALAVINGKYGNGDARKDALIKAGYDFNEVQKRVNQILKKSNFKDGDMVKLKSDAVYSDGKQIPQWVKDHKLYIRGNVRDDNTVVISTLRFGDVTGVVNTQYLIKL